jgi:hypothetical protein
VLTQHLVLLGCQALAPLLITENQFVGHAVILRSDAPGGNRSLGEDEADLVTPVPRLTPIAVLKG